MSKAIIYGRVSTSNQDYTRQLNDLKQYAVRNNLTVDRTFTEKTSGTKDMMSRTAAAEMFDYIQHNDTDIVLVSEISRLGRNTKDVQDNIAYLVDTLKVNLYVHQYGLSAYMNGKKNPMFKLISDVLANVAEMENEQRRERIKSGMRAARAKGVHVGRPVGTSKTITDTKNYKKIVRELRQGTSIRKTAKLCDVSAGTVQKVSKSLIHNC